MEGVRLSSFAGEASAPGEKVVCVGNLQMAPSQYHAGKSERIILNSGVSNIAAVKTERGSLFGDRAHG